jgi:hypothetical protein
MRWDAEATGTARVIAGLGGVMALALATSLLAHFGCAGGDPEPVARSAPAVHGAAESTDPSLAIDPDRGDVLIAFLAGDSSGWGLHVSRSSDAGASWSPPVRVTAAGEALTPHGESSPRLLAASGGRLALVWSTSRHVEGRTWPASDVRFSRSLDGGRTWSDPVTLNDDTAAPPGGHSFHGVTLAGGSGLVVAWLDERPVQLPDGTTAGPGDDAASLYVVRSPDFGTHWNANAGVATAVCPCCRVDLTSDGSAALGAWRKSFPDGTRDIVWSELGMPEQALHTDGWLITGCPHSGPALRAEGGIRHAAWFTGAQGRAGVWYRRWEGGAADTGDEPVALITGEKLPTAHVALAVAPDRSALIACDVSAGGAREITIVAIDSTGGAAGTHAVAGSTGGTYPQLVRIPSGDAVVAWSVREGGRAAIRVARWARPK